jgi:hypothetical protein
MNLALQLASESNCTNCILFANSTYTDNSKDAK